MTGESLYPRPCIVLCLRSGQTVRLPLRKDDPSPVGNAELEVWIEKRPDVLVYREDYIEFAYVEHGDQP